MEEVEDLERYGITKKEWEKEPYEYLGECHECGARRVMTKGSIREFDAYGVYICSGCGYAYPPGYSPEKTKLSRRR